jgi:hypothetical protein
VREERQVRAERQGKGAWVENQRQRFLIGHCGLDPHVPKGHMAKTHSPG